MKSAIEKLNYEVKDLVLAREVKVPDDATIVVVAGPQREPSTSSTPWGYVARAGRSSHGRSSEHSTGPRALGARPATT
jgi:hypothetical protein